MSKKKDNTLISRGGGAGGRILSEEFGFLFRILPYNMDTQQYGQKQVTELTLAGCLKLG